MKNTIIVLLLLLLLLSGCSNESVENNSSNKDDVSVSLVPSQFVSEDEMVKTVNALKRDPKEMAKTEFGGEISNKDELDKIDYYYMPVVVPEDYELYQISVTPDNFRSIYVKKGEDYDHPYDTLTFGNWKISSGWTMENTIKGSKLVQSEYSSKLYFEYRDTIQRYLRAYFEVDNQVCYVLFPFEISLDDEEQVKMIEELCQMEKKIIE